MTLDEWNKVETARILRACDRYTAFYVKAVRVGGNAKGLFWWDYVEWCEKNNVVPEGQWV